MHHALALLKDVGLGYLTLGQQSPTLSGGEAQRIKLVTELARIRGDLAGDITHARAYPAARAASNRSIFWTSQQLACIWPMWRSLSQVLHRLVDAGNTVIVVEHNLDVMAEADWIIDMGPEAGDAGGRVVVAGTPAQVAARKGSRTGVVLADSSGKLVAHDIGLLEMRGVAGGH